MAESFDIYFSGQCLDGFEPEAVRDGLIALFNMTPDAAAQLMNGTRHRIKARCDANTVTQFETALHRVGAAIEIVTIDLDAAPADDNLWTIAPLGSLLSEAKQMDPVVITTPDYSLAEVGAPIPTLVQDITPLSPRTDHLSLIDRPHDE
jgi:hypothetical protein